MRNITEKEKRKVRKLQPIISRSLFERWEIDLFNFDRVDIVDGVPNYVKCYVVQCLDHKSKLRFAEYIPSKNAIHVISLYRFCSCHKGTSIHRRLHTRI